MKPATAWNAAQKILTPGASVAVLLPANTTSCTSTGLLKGMRYWFRVQATNDYGSSPYSNEDDAVPMNILNLLADDFDPGLDFCVWAAISGGLATNGGQGFRAATTPFISLPHWRTQRNYCSPGICSGRTIQFLLRAGNEAVDGDTYWNNSEVASPLSSDISETTVCSLSQLLRASTPSIPRYPPFGTLEHTLRLHPEWALSALGSNTQFRLAGSLPTACFLIAGLSTISCIQGAEPPSALSCALHNFQPQLFHLHHAVLWIGAEGASSYQVERKNWHPALDPHLHRPFGRDRLRRVLGSPGHLYSYRVRAVNIAGTATYSPVTTSSTWSQTQHWLSDNDGTPEAMTAAEMTIPVADGSLPLTRYAFNLTADEPVHYLAPGGTSGYPYFWFDPERSRLCVELIRRKASMNPGITCQVEFGGNLSTWTREATLLSITSHRLHLGTRPL